MEEKKGIEPAMYVGNGAIWSKIVGKDKGKRKG